MRHYKHVFSEWIYKLHGRPMVERAAFRDLVEFHACNGDRDPALTLAEAYRVCGALKSSERKAVRAVLAAEFIQVGNKYACPWAEELFKRQAEQQERLRSLKAGDGWARFRDEILERDGYRCVYCGADGPLELDHVFPRSRGGIDHPDNLAAACKPCNTSKGARTVGEWKSAAP